MKIAVTYDNGNIFQHFGRTETFKVYTVEDGKVISSEVISSGTAGHEALAGVLADQGAEVLICGGIGDGAMNALMGEGIEVCSGASGDTDAAVAAYLAGELDNEGINCDHHHHEEESEEEGCGCGCGENCGSEGSSCGCGCGGCGGHAMPQIEGKNAGRQVKVHYTGTLNDGTQFDSSYDRGEPLEFICGAGMMIRGFDAAVAVMEVGEIADVHLMPEEAYGPVDPYAIMTFEIASLPGAEGLNAGEKVYLSNEFGQRFLVTVTEKTDTHITLDANHEMAGKELNFRIELVEVK